MHHALVALKVGHGVLAFSIGAELIPRAWGRLSAPRPFVAHVAPHPGGLGLAGFSTTLHPDRGVICEQRRPGAHHLADRVGQRLQQGCGATDPIAQGGPMNVHVLAGIDRGLSVKGQMIAILADDHMRQQSRPRTSAFDRAARQGRLCEGITGRTRHPRADDFADDEAPGDILQLRGHVFAERAQCAAALRAGFARRDDLLLAFQMVRQRGAAVLAFLVFLTVLRRVRPGCVFLLGGRGLPDLPVLLKIERKLVGTLGLGPEPRLAVASQLMFQLLYPQCLSLRQIEQSLRGGAQFPGVGWQGPEGLRHGRIYTGIRSPMEC